MTGSIGFTVPAIVSKGLATSFEAVTSNLTAPDAAALTYTWAAPEFSPDTHTGATYTPTAPATPGTYPVALTVSSEGYCDLLASKTVTVIDCIPSTVYDLEVSASGFCEGDAGVTFALSGTDDGASYELYRDGAPIGATLEGTDSPATFSGFFEAGTYSARTVPGGAFCPAEMNRSLIISRNSLPAAPIISKPNDVCLNGGNLVFTANNYSGSLEWVSNGGGSVNGNSVTFASGADVGTKTVIARSAQTYTNGAPTCYSTTMTQTAVVKPVPAITAHPASTATCAGTTVTLSVAANDATGGINGRRMGSM
jgi:hypothetical protein